LFLLSGMLLLSSCQDVTYPDTDTTEEVDTQDTVDTNSHKYAYYQRRLAYEDGYLYFMSTNNTAALPATGVVGSLMRYNIKTGNVTYVCPDPLCMHGTIECPFAGHFSHFAVIDRKILYRKRIRLSTANPRVDPPQNLIQYCMFDTKKMEYSVLLEHPVDGQTTNFFRLLYHKDMWYTTDWNISAETGETVKNIRQLNTKTGEAVLVNNEDFSYNNMLFILNDRIYFSDPASIFSTDLNLRDKTVHAEDRFASGMFETNGESVFYGETVSQTLPDESKVIFSNLYSYHLQTGEKTDLEIQTNPDHWFITDKYIYYMPVEPSGVKGAGSPFNCSGVWRCHHDGTGKEKVFDLYRYEEGAELPGIIFQLWDPVVVDNVMYSLFGMWEDLNGNGIREKGEGDSYSTSKNPEDFRLLKMDLTTNTYEIIYPMR